MMPDENKYALKRNPDNFTKRLLKENIKRK